MAASSNDMFIRVSPNFSTTVGSGGVADGTTTTIPLAGVSNLPTDTAIELVINRVNSSGAVTNNYETVRGVISGSNLTSCVRGVEGTAQGWDAGTTVEYLATGDIQNRMVTGILVDHDQSGRHKTLTDANGNEWIKQTATSSAVNEFTVANAATGNNPVVSMTGGDSNVGLDLKMKGTAYFRKPVTIHVPCFGASSDVATGDGKAFFEVSEEINGMNMVACGAYVYTAGTTGTMDIQIRNVTDSQDMLSTKITIDSTEVSSRTAATAPVINTSYDDVVTGDRIAFDFDAVQTTKAKGAVVWMRFELP